jgi:hypothetical protein
LVAGFRNLARAIVAALAVLPSAATAQAISQEAGAALSQILPEGYRRAAVLPCELDSEQPGRFVAALVDTANDDPQRVVRLLYLSWNGRWTVVESIAIRGGDPELDPQYLSGISVVRVGSANLLYVYTTWFGGGSGSLHYFQFFDVVAGHLKLVRGFAHHRMERGLLSLRNDRIYDAEVACSRGQKVGRSYVYSCHLETTEFTYDGQSITAVRTERLEERTGNRFLADTYRNLSLRSILKRGGHFLTP